MEWNLTFGMSVLRVTNGIGHVEIISQGKQPARHGCLNLNTNLQLMQSNI